MRVFLAGTSSREKLFEKSTPLFVLESFLYFKPWQRKFISSSKMFMLDSGAFTFMQRKRAPDFNKFVDSYANFINSNDISYFFELDVDSIIGYCGVRKLRSTLEKNTGKQCIPVWHKSRGIDEFKSMCKEYPYVAIGGIASKEIDPTDFAFFTYLIDIAHENGCKIHGLGFSNPKGLLKCPFDSVDSTSWNAGSKFGRIFAVEDGVLVQKVSEKYAPDVPKTELDKVNLNTWIDFQKYAEFNL